MSTPTPIELLSGLDLRLDHAWQCLRALRRGSQEWVEATLGFVGGPLWCISGFKCGDVWRWHLTKRLDCLGTREKLFSSIFVIFVCFYLWACTKSLFSLVMFDCGRAGVILSLGWCGRSLMYLLMWMWFSYDYCVLSVVVLFIWCARSLLGQLMH